MNNLSKVHTRTHAEYAKARDKVYTSDILLSIDKVYILLIPFSVYLFINFFIYCAVTVVNRDSLTIFANDLRVRHGPAYLVKDKSS